MQLTGTLAKDAADLLIEDQGITYIYYRTVSASGARSIWVGPEVVKLDSVTPTIALAPTKYCSGTVVNSGVTSDDLLEYELTKTSNNPSGVTITYCKDTTNSCTPNLEYNEKVYIEDTGTYYVRYKITSGSGKSSDIYSYKAVVNDTTYCAVNLIKNGSFENQGWGNCTYSTEQKLDGNYSCKLLNYGGVETTSASLESLYLNNTHKYYTSIYIYANGVKAYGSDGYYGSFAQVYWPIAEPPLSPFLFLDNNDNDKWIKYSNLNNRDSFSSGNYNVRIDFDHLGDGQFAYYDNFIIVDLTDTFGAGNEPSKEWCDNNLEYFDGRKILNN